MSYTSSAIHVSPLFNQLAHLNHRSTSLRMTWEYRGLSMRGLPASQSSSSVQLVVIEDGGLRDSIVSNDASIHP